MSDPQLYVAGNWESGNAMLQCEREECRVPGNCASGLCWWHEDLPYHATPSDVIDAYQRHLKTHLQGPEPDRPDPIAILPPTVIEGGQHAGKP